MNLAINDIRLSYAGREILKGCSYRFDRPGTYVLTGENGSGKSTLLRVCALLEPPLGGTVGYYDGDNMLEHAMALRRRITIVLPRIGVFNASVHENAAYGLRIRKVPRGQTDRRVAEALDFVGLGHKARQNALTLSSGETQRLGMARALIIGPEVLFLDEPTASVDKKNIAIIEDIISNLKDNDRIIVMTTHDEHQAGRLGDTVLHMDEGALR